MSTSTETGPPIGVEKGPPPDGGNAPDAPELSVAQAGQARFWAWRVWSGAVFEAPALVAGLDDVAVVGEPVEERGGHLGVAEDAGPFSEGEIGGDDHRGPLVEAADQVEQQLSAGLAKGR